jgi:predicted O-linked N-acetylglucosamine transferase (SPINDLY family)
MGYVGFHDHDRFDICVFTDDDQRAKLPDRDSQLAAYRLKEVDLAQACAATGIDLVVDLIGPYPRSALLGPYRAMCKRIAPVQCLWINSFGTTGAPGYDYLIADRGLIRPGEERWFTERVIHMPHCQWFWTPPARPTDPGPLPAETNGHVTFGSANRGLKLNDAVLSLWAEVMARLPDARLRLVGWHTEDWPLRRRISAIFDAHGVDSARIDLVAGMEPDRLPTFYRTVDLTLDTFPFNGGLTTLESLWMGVPVIALAGATFTGRQTESILRLLGHADWIAPDRAGFVARAVALAGDLGLLTAARTTLRDQMRASPLCDGPGFARDLEALFIEMLAGAGR